MFPKYITILNTQYVINDFEVNTFMSLNLWPTWFFTFFFSRRVGIGIMGYLIGCWQTSDGLVDAMMKSNMNASARGSVLGGFSFEADSLAEFSEFDSTSVVLEYQAERYVLSR